MANGDHLSRDPAAWNVRRLHPEVLALQATPDLRVHEQHVRHNGTLVKASEPA